MSSILDRVGDRALEPKWRTDECMMQDKDDDVYGVDDGSITTPTTKFTLPDFPRGTHHHPVLCVPANVP